MCDNEIYDFELNSSCNTEYRCDATQYIKDRRCEQCIGNPEYNVSASSNRSAPDTCVCSDQRYAWLDNYCAIRTCQSNEVLLANGTCAPCPAGSPENLVNKTYTSCSCEDKKIFNNNNGECQCMEGHI